MDFVASKTEAATAAAREDPIPVIWALDHLPENSLLLECVPEAGSCFTARFISRLSVAGPPALEIFFADGIAAATLNGKPLVLEPAEDGFRARVAPEASNTLRFLTTQGARSPFTWVRGLFRVRSGSPFRKGPGETIKTDGPFTLEPATDLLGEDLVAGGFPFLRLPLFVSAYVTFPRDIISLRLDGVAADAVRLTVDDRDLGWTWSANYDVPLPAGERRLRMQLIPNTYNSMGPHHYYRGDGQVISPGQMQGVRNFADPEDAPENTHVAAWHFRRFRLPGAIIARLQG